MTVALGDSPVDLAPSNGLVPAERNFCFGLWIRSSCEAWSGNRPIFFVGPENTSAKKVRWAVFKTPKGPLMRIIPRGFYLKSPVLGIPAETEKLLQRWPASTCVPAPMTRISSACSIFRGIWVVIGDIHFVLGRLGGCEMGCALTPIAASFTAVLRPQFSNTNEVTGCGPGH